MMPSSSSLLQRRNWKSAGARRKHNRRRRYYYVAIIVVCLVGCVCWIVGGLYNLGILTTTITRVGVVVPPQPLQKHQKQQRKALSSTNAKNQKTNNEEQQQQQQEHKNKDYWYWKKVAIGLSKLPPKQILDTLNNDDPFETRQFAQKLKNAENDKLDHLSLSEISTQLFPCPTEHHHRISIPDQRNHSQVEQFLNGHGFLFFQHLRKAGGTNFCTLAEANLPKQNVPRYYCMPDFQWPHTQKQLQSGHNCAGCLHQWSNEEIVEQMGRYRIAGNEWNAFDPTRHFQLPAVFVTSFRRPLDRAVSQFRFECVEQRGCQYKNIGKWWKKRRDLYNVYTWTFSDVPQQARIATADQYADNRADAMGKALDTIAKFHLVLAMEWLGYAESSVKHVLGFSDTSALTRPVRPHNQRARNDSWVPEDYLSKDEYRDFSKHLALDEILTDAAHRLFLERLVCNEL